MKIQSVASKLVVGKGEGKLHNIYDHTITGKYLLSHTCIYIHIIVLRGNTLFYDHTNYIITTVTYRHCP